MKTKIIAVTALATILAACGPAVGQQADSSGNQTQTAPAPSMMGRGMGPGMGYGPGYGMGYGYGMGPGMMGYGMGPRMMGQGMMGYGMGPGMMGQGMMGYGMGPGMMGRVAPVEELSVKDVKTNFERWLAWMNNPNLKLGKVKEKDKDTITAEIVTKDNSLVRRFEINRETGFVRPIG
jgi:hypothetical protein